MTDTLFPFAYPWQTAFYLVVYMLTLALHVVPMNCVLAGSMVLFSVSLWPRRAGGNANGNGDDSGVASAPGALYFPDWLRDWMPFLLGVAITAGVAPLLFVQILYQKNFYTANLLLFNRWMAILPVLIIGFYTLYLIRAKRFTRLHGALRFAIALFAMSCFIFIGWSWTENHLLSLNAEVWVEQYVSKTWVYRSIELPPRLVVWFAGAFASLATVLGWAAWWHRAAAKARGNALSAKMERSEVRWLALLAWGGLIVAGLGAAAYAVVVNEELRALPWSRAMLPYTIVAIGGIVVQAAAWGLLWSNSRFDPRWLGLATGGMIAAMLGAIALREGRRVAAIGVEQFYDRHAAAAEMGGLPVFLGFFAFNAAVIVYCVLLVRKNLRQESEKE